MDVRRTGIVQTVKCHDCPFTYIGEGRRSCSSRGVEHDPGRACHGELVIKQHAQRIDHDIHPRDATILKRGITSCTKRLFLESWHSAMEADAGNEKKVFRRAYTPLVQV